MDMEFPKEDYMVLDVEKTAIGGASSTGRDRERERERERDRDRDKNRSMVVSVVSTPESHAVTLNGYGASRRNSTPSNANNNVDDTSSALLKRINQTSRDSSLHARPPPEHHIVGSSKKSHPPSDEDSSDDLALDAMPRPYKFPAATLPTGLCYDVRMRYHCELDPPKQRLDFHPEDPRRIYSIYKELCTAGLVDDPMSTRPIVSRPLKRISARNATRAEVCMVHDPKHFSFIEGTKDMSEETLVHLERQYDSIYFNRLTYASALLSAGGAIDTCRAVASRQVKNAMAVIRPPGHHAECNRPMGFCIFDNVSISAKVCQTDFPDTCRKILILDWDVHHGNGIQQAFYQDPNVLYISIHVHEDGNFYPSGPYGDHLHCGAGPGRGDVMEGAYLMVHLTPHCENCGTLDTPQWRKGWYSDALGHPVNLCNACGLKFHKGQCCPYCKLVYGKELKVTADWLSCVGCGRHVHHDCESIHGGNQFDADYLCPNCHRGSAPSYHERIAERSTTPYGSFGSLHAVTSSKFKRSRVDFESSSPFSQDSAIYDRETVSRWA